MNNRDFLLGLLLIILVGTSLLLSNLTWWRLSYGTDAMEAGITALKVVDLSNVVAPDRVVLHFGQNTHGFINHSSPHYEKIWNYVRESLSDEWPAGAKEAGISPEKFQLKRGLELFFATPLPVDFLTKVLNIKGDEQAIPQDRLVDSIVIVEDDGLSVFLKEAGGRFFRLKNKPDSSDIRQILEDVSAENPPLFAYLPPAQVNLKLEEGMYVPLPDTQNHLPVFTFKLEKRPGPNNIAKFFSDFSITRRIEEKDGAVIYTDGSRGLRIYPDGAVEYSRPVPRDQKHKLGFYEALNLAVDFVNAHGGWPRSGYLSGYKISGNQVPAYTFNFGVRVKGLPLVEQKDYLTVTVEGNQVSRYYRRLVREDRVLEEIQPISPIQALDAAIVAGGQKEIKSLRLVYTSVGNTLIPVWTVDTKDRKIFIDARNGMVMNLN
ncbi:YycH family regulatory protein [Thermosediminibacter litoriperuensis]|uniref:Regulatory protein YycH of two-component signal transduction system YycFG n=1 Tax=Thermosediminibacter litoriperuensis TaxID=291989 RepID=A0A5S5AWW2_9FIRM|nr:two-component system activity regulator YycH [Thermosediminibacter litoriperuensis]TYP57452.1 regulatory protein YycH of two-component signal transduction system YycFG [Thermosediminibacter litoriperuensis]